MLIDINFKYTRLSLTILYKYIKYIANLRAKELLYTKFLVKFNNVKAHSIV